MSFDIQHGASLVAGVLENPNNQSTLSSLVTQCRRLALRHVRRKTSPGQLDRFGLSAEDLALDSIAELFEQSADGEFPRLRQHFDQSGAAARSDEEMQRALRRLVGGAVNDRLFQVCQEHDPGLARLIRNLKRAARKVDACALVRTEGRLWITSTQRAADTRLPLLPASQLEEGLRQHGCANASEAVRALLALLDAHPNYRNGYPVSSFAVVLRATTARLHLPFLEESSSSGDLSERMRTMLGWRVLQAVTEARSACYAGYVEAGKVPAEHYEAYFRAIQDVLVAEFIDLEGERPPLWTFLDEHLKEALTSATYRRTHRNTFEYLLELSRRELVASLREDLDESGKRRTPRGPSGNFR